LKDKVGRCDAAVATGARLGTSIAAIVRQRRHTRCQDGTGRGVRRCLLTLLEGLRCRRLLLLLLLLLLNCLAMWLGRRGLRLRLLGRLQLLKQGHYALVRVHVDGPAGVGVTLAQEAGKGGLLLLLLEDLLSNLSGELLLLGGGLCLLNPLLLMLLLLLGGLRLSQLKLLQGEGKLLLLLLLLL